MLKQLLESTLKDHSQSGVGCEEGERELEGQGWDSGGAIRALAWAQKLTHYDKSYYNAIYYKRRLMQKSP